MGWVLFLVLCVVAAKVFGWGVCGARPVQLHGGWSGYGGGGWHPDRARRVGGSRRFEGWASGPGPGARGSETVRRPPPLTPAQRRELEISDLRRQYVADEITVDEYESGLDRILRGEAE